MGRPGSKGIASGKPFACAICTSPHRDEIEKLWNNPKMQRKQIFDKYISTLPISQRFDSFHRVMRRHVNERHTESNTVIIALQKDAGLLQPGVTVESFAQKLLELGNLKIQSMDPGDVKIKDVISAQKLLIDKQKIKLSEDAMTVKMAELFGGVVVEGEVLTDDEVLGYTPLLEGTDGNTGTQ